MRSSLVSVAALAGLVRAVSALHDASKLKAQYQEWPAQPWQAEPQYESSFEPRTLASLSSSEFTTLRHPHFPSHSVRIKETPNWCDPTVKVYSGFIDIDYRHKHLFFWFFESRHKPDEDPVTVWINGGPGGSSAIGMLAELGPCYVNPSYENGTVFNPHSWNRKSNLIFLDQPVDVGYSYYSKSLPTIASTPEAAKDVYAFLSIWFETFSQFKSRPFHFAGESFGGRYVPIFASEIYDQNKIAVQKGRTPINLQSVLLGNGWTSPGKLFGSYYDMLCKNASVTPFYDIPVCVELKYTAPECERRFNQHCGRHYNHLDCREASTYCENELMVPFQATKTNWYDISKKCDVDGDMECYKEITWLTEYLQKNETKRILGVPLDHEWKTQSFDVHNAFTASGDFWQTTEEYVTALLERGVKVLVYVGANDLACNYVGNYRMVQELDWSGNKEFSETPLRDWKVHGERRPAGETKSFGHLSWATIRGAGHLAPLDKPAAAAALFERWISGRPI